MLVNKPRQLIILIQQNKHYKHAVIGRMLNSKYSKQVQILEKEIRRTPKKHWEGQFTEHPVSQYMDSINKLVRNVQTRIFTKSTLSPNGSHWLCHLLAQRAKTNCKMIFSRENQMKIIFVTSHGEPVKTTGALHCPVHDQCRNRHTANNRRRRKVV